MPDRNCKIVSGTITHLFGHRFVVATAHGDVLADLTPRGGKQITLRLNNDVTLEGEMKPSELKIVRLTRGGTTIRIDHPKKPHADHPPHADPSIVLASARADGFEILGAPRRKPKHFELLGRRKGEFTELPVERGAQIRKSKPVAKDDHKWASELDGTT
jgi:hypothetical protein